MEQKKRERNIAAIQEHLNCIAALQSRRSSLVVDACEAHTATARKILLASIEPRGGGTKRKSSSPDRTGRTPESEVRTNERGATRSDISSCDRTLRSKTSSESAYSAAKRVSPATSVRTRYSEVEAVRKMSSRSGPPQVKFAVTSGMRITPRLCPSGAWTCRPPGPQQ
jgi:hypothetical protein